MSRLIVGEVTKGRHLLSIDTCQMMSSDDGTPDGDKKMSSRSIAEVIADGSGDDNDSSIDDSDYDTVFYDSIEDDGSDEDNDKVTPDLWVNF
jgi:hypothetical protein